MSYSSWTIDGYGICIDDIKGVTADSIKRMIHMAPGFEKRMSCAENNSIYSYEDDYGRTGLGVLIYEVMSECEKIRLALCDDYNGVQYILYEPNYPWFLGNNDLRITERYIANMFRKYVSALTDEHIDVGYYSVENGG